MKRDLLEVTDLTAAECRALLARAAEFKAMRAEASLPEALRGRTLAMIFERASTRTRVSFEVAMLQLGGHALMMASRDSLMGRGEPIGDTARMLSRYLDGIMIRAGGHEEVAELARHATVPVINGRTDLAHPCQVLADLLTCQEVFGDLSALSVAWVGDGNNLANSWLNAARLLGFSLALACPTGHDPHGPTLESAQMMNGGVRLGRDPRDAARGARVVCTDVWPGLGAEGAPAAREEVFASFIVDSALMAEAEPDAIFLHRLPAHRGEEVDAAVIDGPQSRVWEQAENRLHVQMAALEWLLGGRPLG